METIEGKAFSEGVRNLLVNCAAAKPGDDVLLVHECASEGFYDAAMLADFVDASKRMGIDVTLYQVPFQRDPKSPDPALSARIAQADRTVFFARIGDQLRFVPNGSPETQVVSYALDRAMLSSHFGTANHLAFELLKKRIDVMMAEAEQIRVTCPLGTDFSGRLPAAPVGEGDVSIKRFPMSVFKPADAVGFSGTVAQAGFLVGTGSHYYSPYACELEDTLFVNFEGHHITGFDGPDHVVAAARAHYERVAGELGIDPYFVHSWHAGIHPGCGYDAPASHNFERWSGGAFGNPRLLHFHTCGAYPPGEISLNVVDPTIVVGGVTVWDAGRLLVENVPGGQELLDKHPEFAASFAQPDHRIGTGARGRLSYRG